MIRSIFPVEQADNDENIQSSDAQVIGFKLAKQTDDCQGIQIFLLKVEDVQDDDADEEI